MTARRGAEFWPDGAKAVPDLDLFDLKGLVETLAADLHLPEVSFRPASLGYFHPGRAAECSFAGQPVGAFGQLHPKVATHYGLGDRSILAGEFDLEAIFAKEPDRYHFLSLPRFPSPPHYTPLPLS